MPVDREGREWRQESGQGPLTVDLLSEVIDDWLDDGLDPETRVTVDVDPGERFWQITAQPGGDDHAVS